MPRRDVRRARCLVTGASSGLGRAVVEHLARAGARVLLTGRSGERLRGASEDLIAAGAPEGSAAVCVADLTRPEDRARLIAAADAQFDGALDLLVNAAGVGAYGHFDTHDETVVRRVFEVNVFALIELTRAALPSLRRGRRPAVVNFGSIVARRGLPGRSEYSASKFAVAGFTEALRAEWAKFGIDVLLVNPGFTATAFERNLVCNTSIYDTSGRRTMTADAVAAATLRALSLGRAEITLTAPGRALLLANRLCPRLVDRGLRRFVLRLFPRPDPRLPLPGRPDPPHPTPPGGCPPSRPVLEWTRGAGTPPGD